MSRIYKHSLLIRYSKIKLHRIVNIDSVKISFLEDGDKNRSITFEFNIPRAAIEFYGMLKQYI